MNNNTLPKEFEQAALSGDFNKAQPYLTGIKAHGNINIALYAACCGGNNYLISECLRLGATDFDSGLKAACYNGIHAVALDMIKLGAKNITEGYNYAVMNNHLPLANLLLQYQTKPVAQFTLPVLGSSKKRKNTSSKVVKAQKPKIDLSAKFKKYCKKGVWNKAKDILKNNKISNQDIDDGALLAAAHGHRKIVGDLDKYYGPLSNYNTCLDLLKIN